MAKNKKTAVVITKRRQKNVGGGKASYNRARWWEVACDRHGIERGKDKHRSVKVGPPKNKKQQFGELGCPDCHSG